MAHNSRHSGGSTGYVRIIGGQLRGSRLPVADAQGLRPSSDRVRETVFNWLRNDLAGAKVIDLFAGSGALAIEACSRGAELAILLDSSGSVADILRSNLQRLSVHNAHVECVDAIAWLKKPLPFQPDIVFIDPPFESDLAQQALNALQHSLNAPCKVYLEFALDHQLSVPGHWQPLRSGQTRHVNYQLCMCPAVA